MNKKLLRVSNEFERLSFKHNLQNMGNFTQAIKNKVPVDIPYT